MPKNNIRYESRPAVGLTDKEIKDCSDLFSTSYGMYDEDSPFNPGGRIRMGVNYYKTKYCKEGFFLARAMDGDKQVGQAWYIRRYYKPYGVITWVLQLVVARKYRKRGIASTLLRSIWGFSDDYAWGLATANPCTVKTLEGATCRKCDAAFIAEHLDAIRLIGKDTSFVGDDSYSVKTGISQVDTQFYVDNKDYAKDEGCEKYLGELKPGHEWLAFTFREQRINRESYRRHFARMMKGYESILRDAYGRMQVLNQPWARGTDNEVEFLCSILPRDGFILDLGCGVGRHSLALAKKGYLVNAVDYSEQLFKKTKQDNMNVENLEFVECDARTYRNKKRFDGVICLFDVIGSYPDVKDNKRIIKTAYEVLKTGGYFILSVMNMTLTESIIKDENKGNLRMKPDILLNLAPSRTMQESGAVFSAEYMALDTERNLVYRKEQFDNDNGLPAEYIIRDKRYYCWEIVKMLENAGFSIMDTRYVQAGHFNVPLNSVDKRAKEILVVCKKQATVAADAICDERGI